MARGIAMLRPAIDPVKRGDARCDVRGCVRQAFVPAARGESRTVCGLCRDSMVAFDGVRGCGCGADGRGACDDCRWYAANGARVLVVGERANIAGQPAAPRQAPLWHDLELLRRVGSFRWGRAREVLLAAGVRWDAAINVLSPGPRGSWDAAAARATAQAIAPQIAAEYDLAVLLGARVAAAFGVPRIFGKRTVRWLVLPHPSGMNRCWNVPGAHDAARQSFRRAAAHVATSRATKESA